MMVYLLTNQANGKSYVGQHHGLQLEKRWNAKLNNTKTNGHLQAAIQKYGAGSFTRTVLAFASCQVELDLLEKFFIQMYQTTDPRFGYNQQTGGLIGTGRHSKASILRIRESNLKHWENKKPEERVQFALNAWLRWDRLPEDRKERWANECRRRYWSRPQSERDRTIELVSEHKRGMKHSVPTTLSTRKKLSEALKLHWARKRIQRPDLAEKQATITQLASKEREKRALEALREAKTFSRQLREISEKLNALRFELRGGCNW